MKNIRLFYLLFVAVLITANFACDAPDQEVEPIIGYDRYPKVTITPDKAVTNVKEGDTIVFTITMDKMIDRPLTFSFLQTGGAAGAADFEGTTVKLAEYTTSAQMTLVFTDDNLPENTENLKLEIEIHSLAERYLIHPTSVLPKIEYTISNVYWDGGLTVAFGWANDHNDIDIFSISQNEGSWNLQATGDNPEIMAGVWNEDADGEYYMTLDPYSVEGTKFDYTIYVNHPDGKVEFFTGTFDMAKRAEYTVDYFEYWDMDTYRFLKVVKSGTSYTVTKALP